MGLEAILISALLAALPSLSPLAVAGVKSVVAALGEALGLANASVPNTLKPVLNQAIALGIAAAVQASGDGSLSTPDAALAMALAQMAKSVRDAYAAQAAKE